MKKNKEVKVGKYFKSIKNKKKKKKKKEKEIMSKLPFRKYLDYPGV